MIFDVCEGIENSVNITVSTTKQSDNMNKELKKPIIETVTTLRNLNVKPSECRNKKSSAISELEARVFKLKAELDAWRGRKAVLLGEPYVTRSQEARINEKGVAPSGARDKNLYSEALGCENNLKRFELTVKPKENHSPETIKDY
jgi:hypothetical protein